MKISALALVLSLFGSIETAQAWPNGAGGCITDGPSVGASHLKNMPLVNASLAEAGFELVINVGEKETVLSAGSTPAGLTDGGTYSFTVRATGAATFKGALLRFSENVGEMEPAEWEVAAKKALDVCGPYPSLTHTDASEKTNFTGMMTFTTAMSANLLVDLVIYNSATGGSSYAYSTYPVAIMAGATDPDDGPGDDGAGPPPMNTTLPPPMGNETAPPPMGNETTAAPTLAPVAETMSPTALSNMTMVNVTMGGEGKAPKTVAPMGSDNTTAPTVMPMAANATAPIMAPVTGKPIAPKRPTAAPVAKVEGGAKNSAAVGRSAAYAAAITLVVCLAVVTMW